MPLTTPDIKQQLLGYLMTGIRTAADIKARFGCSQPTVSRMLAACGTQVFTMGETRARRYTCLRDVRGLGGEFPVYKICPDGNAQEVGSLYAVTRDGYYWKPVTGESAHFRSLPWFLSDLRPDGFVGRAFVHKLHQDLLLPPRITDWSEDHVLVALSRRGEDCMGNLIVGEESLERYFAHTRLAPVPVRDFEIDKAYPMMARTAMEGQPVGSSAGGEQPKFTLLIERDNTLKHVMVKFSPPISSVEGRRWADLLICEHHALTIIDSLGVRASRTKIVEAQERVFLEVERFDRVGVFGRLPIISLRAVDNEFYGHQDNWIAAANRLEVDRRLSSDDASRLRWLCAFSDLIANVDQHFGNISLTMVDGRRSFELSPAYDVLPMLYRPRDGVAPTPVFTPPVSAVKASREWGKAVAAAICFWETISGDSRISEEFRKVCAVNLAAVKKIAAGPQLIAS